MNFFVRIGVADDGTLAWVAGNSKPGAAVELRFEMETLVVLSNTPHPLDPLKAYRPAPVALAITDGPPAAADDPCRLSRPENGRGFALTAAYVAGNWPMSSFRQQESQLDPRAASIDVTLPAGEGWTHELAAGQTFRIVDLEGNQAVDTLFFNSRDLDERYSATETIRAQGNIYLTTGTRLMSSEGRPLLTIVADTCGRHDTLGGACSAESNQVRYALDKKYMHSCRDSFLLALARYGRGMTKRDLPSNINFFMNVPVTPAGELTFADGVSGPGRYVEMRAEMDVLVLDLQLPAAQQPLQRLQPDARPVAGLGNS